MLKFDYYKPHSFEQAFELLTKSSSQMRVLAGGTDLIPHTRDGIWQPDAVVDIKNLPGLRDIDVIHMDPCCGHYPGECLYIGAAVQMNEIIHSAVIGSHWNLIQQGAFTIGNEQVRNRATIGGNICTSSPAADMAPGLLVLDAKVLIKGPSGDRCLDVVNFFLNPKVNALKKGELVAGVLIPQPPSGSHGRYQKLSRRKAGDLAIVSVAAMALPSKQQHTWRLALGAVAPTPIRAYASEAILNEAYDNEAIDQAAAAAYSCCCPISDVRSSMEYRQVMVINITRNVIRLVLNDIAEE